LEFGNNLSFVTSVIVVSKFEKNDAQYRRGIGAGLETRIGTEIIRCALKAGFKLLELFFVH
jgi:hypothetical protein